MSGDGAYVTLRGLVQLRYQARGFSYLPAQPVHTLLAGRKRSRPRGRGLDFDELRHYRPGDDIRTMDWRVTRRARSPFVRVFTEERDRPVYLIIDQRLAMFFGSRYQMKSTAAARVAALTAWRVIGVGDRVGALLFNDDEHAFFRPSRSPAGVMRLLERLVTMNTALSTAAETTSQPDALAEALASVGRYLTHDSLVVVISDFDGWSDDCLSLVKRIRHSNDLIAAVVSDPLERSLADADQLVVTDGDFQLQIDNGETSTGHNFQQDYAARLNALVETLKRHTIPVIPLGTETDITSQLLRQLGGAATRPVRAHKP